MFAQVIRGKVDKPELVEESFRRWSTELAPGAKGWLGTTAGVTDDGHLFIMVRFESEEAAQANSDRPEQDAFWAETAKIFDTEPTFRNSAEVIPDVRGDLDSARFVQVMDGTTSLDVERGKQLMADTRAVRAARRPDILGQVVVGYQGGAFTTINYFTNEGEAREGEAKGFPEDLQSTMQEMMSLIAGDPEFLDIRNPWLDSPK